MGGQLQVLYAKECLVDLAVSVKKLRVGLGDAATLLREGEESVAVVIQQPSRWPFGFGKPKRMKLGYVSDKTSQRLLFALDRGAPLKARIVTLEKGHLRHDGVDKIAISIWGEPETLEGPRSKVSIFSPSRINQQVENSYL